MRKFLREFKKFALRSNVMDLAIAVVIGGAINALVQSIVKNIFGPVIDVFTGKAAITALGPTMLASLGSLAQEIVSFLTITLCVFLMLKAINNLHRLPLINRVGDKEEQEPAPPTTEQLLTEIRDLLKAQQAAGRPDETLQEKLKALEKSDMPDRLD
jgi:large conductance mechanosensitive channel protein